MPTWLRLKGIEGRKIANKKGENQLSFQVAMFCYRFVRMNEKEQLLYCSSMETNVNCTFNKLRVQTIIFHDRKQI